ncbi:MAG: hypothetical protein IPM23_18605 [Candidatus Melainabacteria bacterium]|nr:hypothetical protein [Candidatus Melainabacteria bacterium]MBK9144506.1 hypothetical protein [Candidatus Melainabacteria bacterium]
MIEGSDGGGGFSGFGASFLGVGGAGGLDFLECFSEVLVFCFAFSLLQTRLSGLFLASGFEVGEIALETGDFLEGCLIFEIAAGFEPGELRSQALDRSGCLGLGSGCVFLL